MIRPVRAEVRTIYFYFCPYRAKQYCLWDTQGDALGYGNHWAFIVIIGCVSAIQASLIAFDLHDDSARPF